MDGALGEIDRRAALVGLAIERAALLDVVRHVGDVHAEPEVAVRQPLDRDRIVEIARVLAVDRDGRHLAEVGAPANVALRDVAPRRTASAIASSECASGMPYLRMMISVSTPGASMSPSTSVTRPIAPRVERRPARQLDGHHLAGLTRRLPARRNDDVHQHAAIEGHDVAHAALVAVVAADEPLVAALEDADDAALGAAAVLDPLDPHDDAVAVHRLR